jgi:hypothetical protein
MSLSTPPPHISRQEIPASWARSLCKLSWSVCWFHYQHPHYGNCKILEEVSATPPSHSANSFWRLSVSRVFCSFSFLAFRYLISGRYKIEKLEKNNARYLLRNQVRYLTSWHPLYIKFSECYIIHYFSTELSSQLN